MTWVFFEQFYSVISGFFGNCILSTYIVENFFIWNFTIIEVFFLSLICFTTILYVHKCTIVFCDLIYAWKLKREVRAQCVVLDFSYFYLFITSLLCEYFVCWDALQFVIVCFHFSSFFSLFFYQISLFFFFFFYSFGNLR